MADTEKINAEALALHKKFHGKLEVRCKAPLENGHDLALAYTPGVAEPCRKIKENPDLSFEYTCRGNMVAVISDGTRVLGLGDIGPEAAMPVMEGKSVLYKKFGDIDSIPICIDTKDPEEFVNIVTKLQPSFGGINLEDIASPKCYWIENELIKRCSIPVFHDDQHGTAIIACAAVLGALRFAKKDITKVKVVVNGCGAAGSAIGKLLYRLGVTDLTMIDIDGAVYEGRPGDMDMATKYLASVTNKAHYKETLPGPPRVRMSLSVYRDRVFSRRISWKVWLPRRLSSPLQIPFLKRPMKKPKLPAYLWRERAAAMLRTKSIMSASSLVFSAGPSLSAPLPLRKR